MHCETSCWEPIDENHDSQAGFRHNLQTKMESAVGSGPDPTGACRGRIFSNYIYYIPLLYKIPVFPMHGEVLSAVIHLEIRNIVVIERLWYYDFHASKCHFIAFNCSMPSGMTLFSGPSYAPLLKKSKWEAIELFMTLKKRKTISKQRRFIFLLDLDESNPGMSHNDSPLLSNVTYERVR